MNPLPLLVFAASWAFTAFGLFLLLLVPYSIISIYRREREQWRDFLAAWDAWEMLRDTPEYQKKTTVCAKCERPCDTLFEKPYCVHCMSYTKKNVLVHAQPNPPKTILYHGGATYRQRQRRLRQKLLTEALEQNLLAMGTTDRAS